MLLQQLLQIKTLKEGQMKNAIMDTVEDHVRNADIPAGTSYARAVQLIVKAIQNTDTIASECPAAELTDYVKDYMSPEEFKELHEDTFDQGEEGGEQHQEYHPDDEQHEEPQKETKIIGKADEFKVELDGDEQVHITDGEGTVRLSMPFMIWKQLTRS